MLGGTYIDVLDDVATRLIEEHWAIAELGTARIRDLPYGAERESLLRCRRDIGLSVHSEDLIMVRADGSALAAHELPAVTRMMKTSRLHSNLCSCGKREEMAS